MGAITWYLFTWERTWYLVFTVAKLEFYAAFATEDFALQEAMREGDLSKRQRGNEESFSEALGAGLRV